MASLGVAVLGEWCGVEGWVEGGGGGARAECKRGGGGKGGAKGVGESVGRV